jgi:hypothetical protein
LVFRPTMCRCLSRRASSNLWAVPLSRLLNGLPRLKSRGVLLAAHGWTGLPKHYISTGQPKIACVRHAHLQKQFLTVGSCLARQTTQSTNVIRKKPQLPQGHKYEPRPNVVRNENFLGREDNGNGFEGSLCRPRPPRHL